MIGFLQPLRRHQILSFILLWFVYCFTYFLRKPIGVVKADIGTELELNKTELGWCDMALVLPYALVQIALPSLTQRFGPRQVNIILELKKKDCHLFQC